MAKEDVEVLQLEADRHCMKGNLMYKEHSKVEADKHCMKWNLYKEHSKVERQSISTAAGKMNSIYADRHIRIVGGTAICQM